MVHAILNGSKTQTRRLMKHQPPGHDYEIAHRLCDQAKPTNVGKYRWFKSQVAEPDFAQPMFSAPYGGRGDRLWVKETFMPMPHLNAKAFYRASDPLIGGKWKPSIFMPRALSRIALEITGIRSDRLQDISEEDAKAEGIYVLPVPGGGFKWAQGEEEYDSAKEAYQALWESINGPRSWDANPWVWVVEFKALI